LPGGGSLETPHDARAYILALPERTQARPEWQYAAKELLRVGTELKGWEFIAHIAVYRAIHGNRPQAPKRMRKPTFKELRAERLRSK